MSTRISFNSQDSNNLVSTLKGKFINIYRILYDVDPKEADKFQSLNHYYFEKSHEHDEGCKHDHAHDKEKNHQHNHGDKHAQSSKHGGGCHSHNHDDVTKKFFIPEKERSFMHQLLYELLKDYKLQEVLPDILDNLAKKFENIKKGGIKDNLEWSEEAEQFVLTKVLTEGFTKALANELKKQLQRDQHVDSKQPLLLATPQAWYEKFPKVKLDFLNSSTIGGLLDKGYSSQKNFIDQSGFPSALAYEVKYFYHEGRFESPSAAEEEQRNDKNLSFQFTDIDSKTSKNLHHVCKVMTALAFELNLKANIYAQVSEGFQLSYFSDKDGFQKIHYDSSFQEKYDSGKKFSAFYVFSSESHSDQKPKLIIHKKESTDVLEEINLEIGELTLLKSRVFPYALAAIPAGTFVLRYWVNGPADKAQKTM